MEPSLDLRGMWVLVVADIASFREIFQTLREKYGLSRRRAVFYHVRNLLIGKTSHESH